MLKKTGFSSGRASKDEVWQKHNKSLGQNFIMDEKLLERVYSAANIEENAHVLEIGTGLGTLTKILAAHCEHVTTVEIDQKLIPLLNAFFEKVPQVQIVQGDILKVDLEELTKSWPPFHVIANIPYYITTDILTRLLFSGLSIKSINLMVQKEAAQRITAQIGDKNYCLLSLQCMYFGSPSIVMEVGRECFEPQPNVDSAFVSIPMNADRRYKDQPDLEKLFFRICACAFAMRRKTIQNNIMQAFSLSREASAGWLELAGIEPLRRGETLTLDEFYRLTESYSNQK